MGDLIFDSENLGEIEAFLSTAYTTMQIGSHSTGRAAAHVRRAPVGGIELDRLDLSFDMAYDADPLGRVCLVTVHAGAVQEHYRDVGTDVFTPGETGLLTGPDVPYSGVIRKACFDVALFEPELLHRLTGPVRFTGHRPPTRAAAARLAGVIGHLRGVAADPETAGHPLVAATAADYLAATVLATLPTTAEIEPRAADRNDAHPATLRRAIAHLETHVREDLTVAAVAAAVSVTPRALQLTFRRHLGTTPLRYLQRLRLAGAHEQLTAARPGAGETVTSIAYGWGFGHVGRFAVLYRRHYGRNPSETLWDSGFRFSPPRDDRLSAD